MTEPSVHAAATPARAQGVAGHYPPNERGPAAEPSGVLILGPAEKIESVSPGAGSLFDCGDAELLGCSVRTLIPGFVSEDATEEAPASAARGTANAPQVRTGEAEALRGDGSAFPVSTALVRIDAAGQALKFLVVSDLSSRRAQEERLHKFERAIEQSADLVVMTNRDGFIEYVNPAFERHTGYTAAQALGRRPNILKSGQHTREYYHRLWQTICEGEVFRDVVVNRKRSGELFYEEKTISPIRGRDGRIINFVSTAKDVTDRVRAEAQLAQLANFDPLTGLPNRTLFKDRLDQALAHAERAGTHVALFYLDLDRFKAVNDSLGHAAGDNLLQAVALRIRSRVRECDTVARLGGDEFAVILTDLATPHESLRVVSELLACFKLPLWVEQWELRVTASIGISVYPHDGGEGKVLLRNADTAMYRAKALGRNTFQRYDPEMGQTVSESLAFETSLRRAVDARELELAYQPVVDAATGEVHAFEALLRWNRPGHGVVTAERLIPVLEETGWIVEVGEWVLRTACRDVAFLREAASRAIRVAVNISSRQLAAPDFVANVAEILADAETPPGAIDLEITESTVMETAGFATSKLQELAAIGVRIALDDFGIGYSSLGNLDRLPVQLIKIDRSLVAGLGVRRSAGSIVEAIVTLAKGLGLSVVAEGIENQTQLELLDRLGCGLVQGNLFSAPLALAAAAALLQSPKPDHESR